ncbi:MAG: hypothetical protein AAFR76_15965, partial [Planctomycetota bacterium]
GRDQPAGPENHNIYIQRGVTGLVIRDSLIARGSSHGVQARNGGDIIGNVFWRNAIDMVWGNEGKRSSEPPVIGGISGNVVLESTDIASSAVRRWGFQLMNGLDFDLVGNVFASPTGYSDSRAILMSDNNPSTNAGVVKGNAVDGYETALRIGADDVRDTGLLVE